MEIHVIQTSAAAVNIVQDFHNHDPNIALPEHVTGSCINTTCTSWACDGSNNTSTKTSYQ